MELTKLNPRWVGLHNWCSDSVFNIGISFDSPITGKRLAVLFKPAIDPDRLMVKNQWGDYFPQSKKWERIGDTFETLTLKPSLDFSNHGEWHGVIANGDVR